MLKLPVLFSTIIFTSGAIFHSPDLTFLDESNDVSKIAKFHIRKVDESKIKDVWVLALNEEGLDFKKMRTANQKEEEAFERVVGPMIDTYKHRPARVVKNEPAKETSGKAAVSKEKRNKKIKQEMMRLINKFVMSMKSDPDVFITDSASIEATGPTLVLYIRGGYTSLTVSSEHKQWHFFIPPPSPLPAWLYEEHQVTFDSEEELTFVDIPDYVRDQLYEKLLHLLNMFLSFPV